MKMRLLLAVLIAGLASPALAQTMGSAATLYDYKGQPLGTSANPLAVTGGGSAAGSVTAAGTNGTSAQAVQGITGGVPVNGFTGQYNSTLPTLASGATGYLAVDINGRALIGSIAGALPAGTNALGTVGVTSLPAIPAGTNAIGTVGINAALPAGANTIGSVNALGQFNTTLPTLATGAAAPLQLDSNGRALIGSIAAPLPAGTNALGTVGVTSLPAIPAGSNTIGSTGALSQYNTTLPTLAAGASGILQSDANGRLLVGSIAGALPAGSNALGTVGVTSLPALAAGTNAIGTVALNAAIPAGANTIGGVNIASALPAGSNTIGAISNIPANIDTGALITLSAASAGVNGTDQINTNGRGVRLYINVTAISGTSPSLTVYLQMKDPVSGNYYGVINTPAITTTGLTVLNLYPGIAGVANVSANDVLSRTWRVAVAIGGTTPSVTATVGASVIN